MSKFLNSFYRRLTRSKFKNHLIDERYRAELAFEYDGVKYYHFPDDSQAPAGRQFGALMYYEEMRMNIDRKYVEDFVGAMEKVINDPKKISIANIALMVRHMKERLQLMTMPDYIYRLASVMFFDDTESIYQYDYAYNQKKIEKWKKNPEVLSFFLQTPLKDLIPLSKYAGENFRTFFPVMEKADTIHRGHLTAILSEKE